MTITIQALEDITSVNNVLIDTKGNFRDIVFLYDDVSTVEDCYEEVENWYSDVYSASVTRHKSYEIANMPKLLEELASNPF